MGVELEISGDFHGLRAAVTHDGSTELLAPVVAPHPPIAAATATAQANRSNSLVLTKSVTPFRVRLEVSCRGGV